MNFETMSAKDLRAFREKIDETIARKQAEAKTELRAKFKEMASSAGLRLDDLINGRVSTSRKSTKQMTPMKDSKTGVVWRGAGRYPRNFKRERALPLKTVVS